MAALTSLKVADQDAIQLQPQTRCEPVLAADEEPVNANQVSNDAHDENVPVRSKWRLAIILICLFLSLFVAALDQTMMATAIPTITSELKSAAGYTWIGGAYLLGNAAGAPIWAKLSDIWGRKIVLLTAIAWFFVASIICATAKNMTMLIAGRALQGTAAGGLLQLVTITVSDLFSMRARALYLGLMEFVWCLAGGLGPLLGGAFAEYTSWRWSYWLNLPISGPTFLLLLLFLDVHNPRTGLKAGIKAIDWFGSLSILAVTLMILLGLQFGGETFPWDSPKVICLIVFGCLMTIFFVFSEKKLAKYPLMPMRLFHNGSNVALLTIGFLHGLVFIAGEYYIPLYLQSVFSASAFRSGLLLLPIIVTSSLSGILCGVIIHRTGHYREIIWGALTLLTLATGLYIKLDTNSSVAQVCTFEILAGIGSGALFNTPLIAIQATVAQKDTATATSTLGFARNIGEAVSIVIGGVVVQNSMTARSKYLAGQGVPANITLAFSGADAAANVILIPSIPNERDKMLVREAFAWSMKRMWIMYTCFSAVALVASVFVMKTKLSREHEETKTGLFEEDTKKNTSTEVV